MAADVKILRGNIIHTPALGELETLAGGYLVLEDGVIQGAFPPCGVCRQVMREFCGEDFLVYLITDSGYETVTLGDLLPHSFSAGEHMKQPQRKS